jgi:hypothetical protein
MAGYDFSFQVPERLRKEASNWLRFVQRLSKTRELDLMYRSAKSLPPTAEFHVRIDGPLPEMQRLQRQLPEFALPYVLSRNGKTNDAVKTISRFIAANQGGHVATQIVGFCDTKREINLPFDTKCGIPRAPVEVSPRRNTPIQAVTSCFGVTGGEYHFIICDVGTAHSVLPT